MLSQTRSHATHLARHLRRCLGPSHSPTRLYVLIGCVLMTLLNSALLVHYGQNAYSYVQHDLLGGYQKLPQDVALTSCEELGWDTRRTGGGGYAGGGEAEDDRRIYAGFTFFSELDILELRLAELSEAVDYFVLVEEATTFSGKAKPLYFERAKDEARFKAYEERIIHVVLGETKITDAWQRQARARSGIVHGLDRHGARGHDLVLLGDLDEIPRAEYVKLLHRCKGYPVPVTFHMFEYYYDFGCRDEHSYWTRVRMLRRDQLTDDCEAEVTTGPTKDRRICPDHTRENDAAVVEGWLGVERGLRLYDAGWYLSFFMGLQQIMDKVGAYAHTERDNSKNHDEEYLKCLISQCVHVNGGSHGHRDSVPDYHTAPAFARDQYLGGHEPWAHYFPEPDDLEEGAGCSRSWWPINLFQLH